jgi:hypothetical protein
MIPNIANKLRTPRGARTRIKPGAVATTRMATSTSTIRMPATVSLAQRGNTARGVGALDIPANA